MKVLLDYITFKWQTGAGEYARRIYHALQQKIAAENLDVQMFALYDSSEGIAYEDMQASNNGVKCIEYLDIHQRPLTQLIEEKGVDVFFVACAQYLGKYQELQDVKCRTICVIHDLAYEEMFTNCMDYYFKLINPKYKLGEANESSRYVANTLKIVKWFFDVRRKHSFEYGLSLMKPVLSLLCKNECAQVVTVSEFTRNSLSYQYGIKPEKCEVLYSPERRYTNPSEKAQNQELAELIDGKRKYYLMLNANRNSKNPNKAVKAFKKYAAGHKDSFLVVVGYPEKAFDNMLNLPRLNDSDFVLALQHCYALVYPTFFEGFGYPAIEAMHYGKPVLASYATSLPELLEDAPIWFSPIYETEIYNAFTKLTRDNYQFFAEKSTRQYEKIHLRQEKDLNVLLNMILNF